MADVPPELAEEVQKLERYHTENPQGRYFVPLANAYRKLGEIDHAEALLREGLRRHPDYLSARIVLGRCLADRGADSDAIGEFTYVLSIDPQNLIALRTLGDMAGAAGRREEATRWYGELLAVDPRNEDARQALEALEEGATGAVGEEDGTDEIAEDESAEGWQTAADGAPAKPRDDGLDWGLSWDAGSEETSAAGAEETSHDVLAWGEVTIDSGALDSADSSPSRTGGGWNPMDGGTIELSSDGPDDSGAETMEGAEGETDGVEVVTETIAELYGRQGFHDRAAEVYRELLRRRGEDPLLRRHLEEAEARAAGDAEFASTPDADAHPRSPESASADAEERDDDT
ncbi:MAG: tetratricopeptide repeat protein, partial [Gemmatimonadota bacterium]|nr:tetratricopeptide repeat protein [Gemmatimonadota bacterium]